MISCIILPASETETVPKAAADELHRLYFNQ